MVEEVRLLVAIRSTFGANCGEIHSHQMNPEFLRQPELPRTRAAGEIAHAGMCSGVGGEHVGMSSRVGGIDALHGQIILNLVVKVYEYPRFIHG